MDEQRLYSTRIIGTYLEYIRIRYPELNINELLTSAGISSSQLDDEGYFFSQIQVNRFQEKLFHMTGNAHIAREAGRYTFSSGAYGAIRQCALGFLTPEKAYSLAGKVASGVTRATTFEAKAIGRDKIEIVVKPLAGVEERPFQCENRMGTLEAVGKLFVGKYPRIDHTTCLHEGGDCCRYVVSLDRTATSVWRQVQRYLPILLVPMSLSFFFLSLAGGITAAALMLSVLATVAYGFERSQKIQLMTHMENQSDAAAQLIEQTNKSYSRTLLIQEVGQAISSILDMDQLLTRVMKILERHLDFDRGLILLSSPDNTRLSYKIGYGFSAIHQPYLKKLSFDVRDLPPGTPFASPLQEHRAILVDGIKDIEHVLSSEGAVLTKIMEVDSFICVPIVYKSRVFGLLLVDNPRSRKPLTQGDMNLLLGVCNQIGISINNAVTYQKILESEAHFRALSEHAPDIICDISEDGTITYVNAVWEKILGHSRQEVLGRKFTEFVPPEKAGLYMAIFKEHWLNRDLIKNIEGCVLSKCDGEKFFSANFAPNMDPDGRVLGVVGILTDITDRRRLETQLRQAQKMEAIGTLAGGIAHDFNNILAAIMGYTEIAMSELDPGEQVHHYLDQVLQSSFRAKDLIKQILAFSRQTEQEFKPLKVAPIIKEAAKLLRASIPVTVDIRLRIETEEDTILGDPTQIHQVLMNLCANAAHAMNGKGGRLEIGLGRIDRLPEKVINEFHLMEREPHLVLTVKDNGHGMDAMTLTRIFDPFFTTKKPGEGTGMGLSVVHGIVKGHKGAILVESQPETGSTFQVFFPLMREEGIAGEIHEISTIVGGNEHILYVDDEPPLVRLGKEMLMRLGYRVTTAVNGLDAFKLFRAQPDDFDLVITDLTMPQMTGLELTEELRKIRTDIPVIVCTGFSESLTMEKADTLGIRDVMMKPIVTPKIAMTIRRVLDENAALSAITAVPIEARSYEVNQA